MFVFKCYPIRGVLISVSFKWSCKVHWNRGYEKTWGGIEMSHLIWPQTMQLLLLILDLENFHFKSFWQELPTFHKFRSDYWHPGSEQEIEWKYNISTTALTRTTGPNFHPWVTDKHVRTLWTLSKQLGCHVWPWGHTNSFTNRAHTHCVLNIGDHKLCSEVTHTGCHWKQRRLWVSTTCSSEMVLKVGISFK